MTVQTINIGNIANDGTGDDLRDAFIKVNQNFEELDLRQPESTTASNVGPVGEGVFAQKVSADLQFKKLVAGGNITLESTDNSVTINALGGLQSLIFSSDSGSAILTDGSVLNIYGGDNISTAISGGTLTINGQFQLEDDSAPVLTASMNADGNSINNVNQITANNAVTNVHGIDIRDIDAYFSGFEFGTISATVTNFMDYLVQTTDVELGTVLDPSDIEIELGGI